MALRAIGLRHRSGAVDAPFPAGALLAAAATLGLAAFLVEGSASLRPWPVLGLWLASLAAFLAGVRLLGTRRAAPAARLALSRNEKLFVAGLTVAALLVRAAYLETTPFSVSGDEAESGTLARRVLNGEVRDPFTTGWSGHSMLWFFMQALSLRVFGDGVVGLRLFSVLLGAAAVPVTYLFARRHFDRSVAVISAVLLAALALHVHYSRIGLNSVADALLMLVAVGALLDALRERSPLRLAFSGVAAGVAQHFYLGARLVPLVMLAVVLHHLAVDRGRLPPVRHLALVPAGFALGYGPGLRVPLFEWERFNQRLEVIGLFQSGWFDAQRAAGESAVAILVEQARRSAGAFTHVADRSPDYWSGMPMLDTVSAALFVVGVPLLVAAWRRPGAAAVLIWLAGTVLAGGVLLLDPPMSHRYVGAAPAACIVVAVAVVRIERALFAAPVRRRGAVVAALVAGIVAWNLNFYFRDYNARYVYGHRGAEQLTMAGLYLRSHGSDSFVYFFGAGSAFLDHVLLRFVAPDVVGTDVTRPLASAEDVPAARVEGRDPLFVFVPDRLRELELVRQRYPSGVLLNFDTQVGDGVRFFSVYDPTPDERTLALARRATLR